MSSYGNETDPVISDKTVFLVVDDFETMCKITVNQLRQLGAKKILTAKDGAEALRVLKSVHVDVVLSDWNMPVMTGLDLLKAVRADDKLFALPLIMITAEAERQRVEEAIACGVTSIMLKPYAPGLLMTQVQRAMVWKPRKIVQTVSVPPTNDALYVRSDSLRARTEAAPSTRQTTAQPVVRKAPQRPTILAVDDTPENLMLISELLNDEFRVRLAVNGEKALEICMSDNPPDLVLLDIMMPGMDGFEVAKRMRDHPNSETIPVIFVTAMNSGDARLKGLDLGAVDFITKPIDPELLKPRVRNFMRYVQLRKSLQADYDGMVETAQLREDVEHITRHDIKGPLAGVLGLVQALIDDEGVSAKHVEQLRLVEETALQVVNMINLSSELFKIETGRFQLNARPVKLGDILRRIVELDRVTYSGKELAISFESDGPAGADMPQSVGDAMLCYSLFQNLLKNACEAAPLSTKVTVKLFDQSPLRIVIENRGAVPAEIRAQFFDKFVTKGKQGGTGLGTYSAKLLTEAQKGSIELAVSDDTDTTTITVLLPRAPAAIVGSFSA